jgi:NAD(P)-dependent dehydrogenase (short-subunit alcohol dehydrogenase family)
MALRSVSELPDAAYVASKAGLIGLTRELASQWGRHGIRVNAVASGFFATKINDGLTDGEGEFPPFLTGRTPLGRGGRLGELDEAVEFLLSRASRFITGAVLTVDGGFATR